MAFITYYKVGMIITDNEGGLKKELAPEIYETRSAAESKVKRLLNSHVNTFKSFPKAFEGWTVDFKTGKVIAPESTKRYFIHEYTRAVYGA